MTLGTIFLVALTVALLGLGALKLGEIVHGAVVSLRRGTLDRARRGGPRLALPGDRVVRGASFQRQVIRVVRGDA